MIKLRFVIECDDKNCDSFINIKCPIEDVVTLDSRYVERYVGDSDYSGNMYSNDFESELKIIYPIQELAKEGWVSTMINYREQIFCPKCVPIYHLKS